MKNLWKIFKGILIVFLVLMLILVVFQKVTDSKIALGNVYVFQVALGGPADRAGLQRDDIILSIDGKEINSVNEIRAAINAHKVGDHIKLTYVRSGASHTVEVTLGEMPPPERS